MGFFVSGSRPRPRRFDYEPRYYDPRRDESLRSKMRVARKTQKRSSPTKALLYGAMVVIALFILNSLDNIGATWSAWLGS